MYAISNSVTERPEQTFAFETINYTVKIVIQTMKDLNSVRFNLKESRFSIRRFIINYFRMNIIVAIIIKLTTGFYPIITITPPSTFKKKILKISTFISITLFTT